MSSHQGSGNTTPVERIDQLVAHHARGERPRADWKVGTEHEKFAFTFPDLRPLPYRGAGGAPGIVDLLEAMKSCCGWQPQVDRGELIALASHEGSIALEPGGQVELSGQPHKTIHETREELDRHVAELERLSRAFPVRWLWIGAQPVHGLDDLGWMPKRRYGVMREYLPTRGRLARYMMQATSTVQANLDFADERDMGRKLRTAMGVSSIVTAMFANSPFTTPPEGEGGKPGRFKTFRAHVWTDTDNDRSGLLPFVFEDAAPTYERYVRWALDVPMFFIVRDGEYLPARGLTFRQFWQRGFHDSGHRATMEDWELHVSTLFPDVRLKTYLETRTADCVQPGLIPALPALWKGVLYSDDTLDAAWDLVRRWSFDERVEHRHAVTRDALQAPIPRSSGTTADLANELLAIARAGLATQARDGGYADEWVHLAPLAQLTASGRAPADLLLAHYASKRWRSPAELLASLLEPPVTPIAPA
ncbi:MAG: glutamate--cysteine ligase [Deltaproteobacteria bacterium]|nr:glutamate--cysteine ligase [Deltaproteobacteria bacterium]